MWLQKSLLLSRIEILLLDIAVFIMQNKILNYFGSVEVKLFVEKWNIYESHTFPTSSVQTCWSETTSLCLSTRSSVNKKFSIYHYFDWNLGNRLTFMCSPLNDKYYLHTRRPNTQENFSYILGFKFQLKFIFCILKSRKACLFTSHHFAPRVMY